MEIESVANAPHNSPMLEECRQLMIENERLRTALRTIADGAVYFDRAAWFIDTASKALGDDER
jgi:hypothetical protein